MPPDDRTADDLQEEWLELCDQAIIEGKPLSAILPNDAPPAVAARRRRAYELLRLLDEDRCNSTDQQQHTLPLKPAAKLNHPLTLPGYKLLEVVGKGGMGVVFKAWQVRAERVVAIKMIRFGLHHDETLRERFGKEARLLAQLKHRNIVPMYDVGEHDDLPFFVMEFVDGNNLSRKLSGKPADPKYAAQTVEQLALAMQTAHDSGILHRDLKPSNVLLASDGTPKISDFGLAKHLDQSSAQTVSGAVLGTPSYMAPEQAAGRTRDIGPATDIYALGAILYEMLTGNAPFQAATPAETMQRVIRDEPSRPGAVANVPRDLEAICLKCLEKQPALRYSRAAALADDLARWQRGEPTHARPAGWPRRLMRRLRRSRLAAALAALVVILAVVFPFLNRNSGDQQNPIPNWPRVLQEKLDKRQPITLIGQVGEPEGFEWLVGESMSKATVAPDAPFTIYSAATALVQLIPHVSWDHYRFRAEVLHKESARANPVGVFIGHSRQATAKGPIDCCIRFGFNDRRAGDVNQGQVVIDGMVGGHDHRYAPGHRYALPRPGEKIWRKMEVLVSPQKVQVDWDGKKFFHEYSWHELSTPFKDQLAVLPKVVPNLAHLSAITVDFQPHSGMGVFVNNGAAQFRNLSIEPLP